MRKYILPLLFILSILLAACGRSQTSEEAYSEPAFDSGSQAFGGAAPAPAVEVPQEEKAVTETINQLGATDSFDASAANAQADIQRLIIRTADMSIVVEDTEEALARLTEMAESNGGWVVNSGVYQYNETAKTGNITIRVPAEGFQSALDAISALSTEVTSLSTSGQDITEEFVDLTARLENLEATAVRVRSFLEDANRVEDALAVNQELSRLEGEIEVLKGRMKYLSQSAAFSTISVNITPDVLSQPIEVGGWRPQGIARQAIETLVASLQWLASVLIWLVIYLLPIALIVGVPTWFVVRLVRRRWQRRQTQATAAEPETTG